MVGLFFCLGCLFGYFGWRADDEGRTAAAIGCGLTATAFFVASLIIS